MATKTNTKSSAKTKMRANGPRNASTAFSSVANRVVLSDPRNARCDAVEATSVNANSADSETSSDLDLIAARRPPTTAGTMSYRLGRDLADLFGAQCRAELFAKKAADIVFAHGLAREDYEDITATAQALSHELISAYRVNDVIYTDPDQAFHDARAVLVGVAKIKDIIRINPARMIDLFRGYKGDREDEFLIRELLIKRLFSNEQSRVHLTPYDHIYIRARLQDSPLCAGLHFCWTKIAPHPKGKMAPLGLFMSVSFLAAEGNDFDHNFVHLIKTGGFNHQLLLKMPDTGS